MPIRFRHVVSIRTCGCALWVAVLAATPMPAAAQSISGTVIDSSGNPLRGVQVSLKDGANAELIATVTTDYNGSYNSGQLPAGDYRVRFSSVGLASHFFGTGFDDYCAGTVVRVATGSLTSGIDAVMLRDEPREVILHSGVITGVVIDAVSGLPLGGMRVRFDGFWNGEALAETSTDASGNYAYPFKDQLQPYRVRFSDPASAHFPQFFGASGRDEFCLAASLQGKDDGTIDHIDASLQPIPPGELTENLLDQIDGLGLPETVTAPLATPLVKAAELLTDGHAANDPAVCAQLTAFITRVGMQLKRGQLSPAEAAALDASAESVKAALGCH